MGDADTLGLPRSDLDQGLKRARRARTARRAGLLALAAICVAALAGLLGPLETTTRHTDDRGELQVTHPRVVRPGMQVSVTVQAAPATDSGSFTLTVDQTLLEDLLIDEVSPLPQAQVADGDRVSYTFQTTQGEATVRLRGRVPPQSTFTISDSTIALTDSPASANDGVNLKVWVLP